jgi:hypothetical protein
MKTIKLLITSILLLSSIQAYSIENPIFVQWVISLNLVLARLRLGLKNRQVGEKWASDDCFYAVT